MFKAGSYIRCRLSGVSARGGGGGERLKLAPPGFSCLLLHTTAYFCLYYSACRYFQQIPVKETLSAEVGGGGQACLLPSLFVNRLRERIDSCIENIHRANQRSNWSVFISVFLRACLRALVLMSKTRVRKDSLFRKRCGSNSVNLLRVHLCLGMFWTHSLLSDRLSLKTYSAFRLYILLSVCVPWESNPQPFALLTQCSTTEPQEHIYIYLHFISFKK